MGEFGAEWDFEVTGLIHGGSWSSIPESNLPCGWLVNLRQVSVTPVVLYLGLVPRTCVVQLDSCSLTSYISSLHLQSMSEDL